MTDNFIFENKKAAFYTLGCKLNFAETSMIGKMLKERGIRKVREGEKADVCVVNTCSVTELADKKCRTMIRRIHREHPEAFIVVTGCYAQLKPEEVAKIEGVDLVLGAGEKLDIIEYMEKIRPGNHSSIFHTKTKDIRSFQPSVSTEGDRTRHFLKVQDGCDYGCTYCTIPKARGRSRNGTIESLVSMARQVADEGGREIVLTGVNIGDFGRTTNESLIDLLQVLDKVDGIDRYRISSIEPNLLTDEIIDFVAESRAFMPHFHMPLQSGSDDVLKLMKRRYDSTLFRNRVEHILTVMPHCFIGIDVIVGTRGELPNYFEDSYNFLSSIPFGALHVFSYSERPGTVALSIPYVVEPKDKHQRSNRLLDLSEQRTKEFHLRAVGQRHTVLWENKAIQSPDDNQIYMEGFTENYIRVRKYYNESSIGQIEQGVIGESDNPMVMSFSSL